MPANGQNPAKRKDAFGAYYFAVQLDHPSLKGLSFPFRSCSGLVSESTVIDLEEGGFNATTRKLIGRNKFHNIVLKQGFCDASSPLWKLRQRFLNDLPKSGSGEKGWKTPERFNGTITQKGPSGAEAKWMFSHGFICKWEGPELDASKNEVSIETIEIAHEGLVMLMESKQE